MSVLGLRRFKETLTPIDRSDLLSYGEPFSDEWYQNIINEFGFGVSVIEEGETILIFLSCVLHEQGTTTDSFMVACIDGAYTVFFEEHEDTIDQFLGLFNRQGTITSTANATVDEWLLANTIAAGETEDTIYREKSSWYKSVADAIRSKKGTTAPILRDDFASEIESISVGSTLPEYDGTVIIEKAESVLGLRRFKETISPIMTLTEDEYIEVVQQGGNDLYSNYGFEIEPIQDPDNAEAKIYGFSCMVQGSLSGETVTFVVMKYGNNDGTEFAYLVVEIANVNAMITQFNIIATANSTVDEWLLANTEGVSV